MKSGAFPHAPKWKEAGSTTITSLSYYGGVTEDFTGRSLPQNPGPGNPDRNPRSPHARPRTKLTET